MPSPDDSAPIQVQLKEKDDLIAALTGQLEKAVNQLDRLRRAGADRLTGTGAESRHPIQNEIGGRLAKALDEWQEFDPTSHIARIERDIDQILDLLTHLTQKPAAVEPAPATDFWSEAKARILAVNPPADAPAHANVPRQEHANSKPETRASVEDHSEPPAETSPDVPTAPEAPAPVEADADPLALWAAVEKRDSYIHYLTSRLRLAESKKYLPVSWDQLNEAPDNYRERLESLETLMQDHLRQAEIANSLERAVLTRERAKLAQIKHNLEIQIKRMSAAGNAPPRNGEHTQSVQSAEQDSRWKRLFSR